MITQSQWDQLHAFVSACIRDVETLVLTSEDLFNEFGIAHPYWEEMNKFAAKTECTYGSKGHWFNGPDPTEIAFTRRG